jgi:hypothetical protein
LATARGPREAPSSAVQEGRQGFEPQKTEMVRAELGLRGRPTVRRDLFAFFAVPILVARCQGGKSRMALRAEHHRQRLSASSAVWSRDGGWPTWGLAVAGRRRLQGARVLFAKLRNNPGLRRGKAPPAGFGAGGGTTRGRTGTGLGGRGFCELAQRPSGQVREGMVQATVCGRVGRRRKALSPGSRVRGQGFSALVWGLLCQELIHRSIAVSLFD